jgi:hypothetical protein
LSEKLKERIRDDINKAEELKKKIQKAKEEL